MIYNEKKQEQKVKLANLIEYKNNLCIELQLKHKESIMVDPYSSLEEINQYLKHYENNDRPALTKALVDSWIDKKIGRTLIDYSQDTTNYFNETQKSSIKELTNNIDRTKEEVYNVIDSFLYKIKTKEDLAITEVKVIKTLVDDMIKDIKAKKAAALSAYDIVSNIYFINRTSMEQYVKENKSSLLEKRATIIEKISLALGREVNSSDDITISDTWVNEYKNSKIDRNDKDAIYDIKVEGRSIKNIVTDYVEDLLEGKIELVSHFISLLDK